MPHFFFFFFSPYFTENAILTTTENVSVYFIVCFIIFILLANMRKNDKDRMRCYFVRGRSLITTVFRPQMFFQGINNIFWGELFRSWNIIQWDFFMYNTNVRMSSFRFNGFSHRFNFAVRLLCYCFFVSDDLTLHRYYI